jgi:hypothetical protein
MVGNFIIGEVGFAIAKRTNHGHDPLAKDNLVRLTLLLIAVVLQFGCSNRICQTKSLKMQWADGTTSSMEIVVCRPLFAWR